MIIVADSGSTKTAWMDVESGNKVVTEGLNPHLTSDEAFLAACAIARNTFSIPNSQFSIFFYGAGCGNADQCVRVASLLTKAFGTNDVHVETDMLGACRALCGHEAGLVGILGTGSNACFYNGKEIVNRAPSLGYILGDHGAANHVGRLLLLDHLTNKMPDELNAMFHDRYTHSCEEWIDLLYHRPNPNRMLASLAPFAVEHIDDEYCRNTIYYALDDWYSYQLADLVLMSGCRRLCVVGGFAAAIGGLLDELCRDNGLVLGSVLANPIERLREYHLNTTSTATCRGRR